LLLQLAARARSYTPHRGALTPTHRLRRCDQAARVVRVVALAHGASGSSARRAAPALRATPDAGAAAPAADDEAAATATPEAGGGGDDAGAAAAAEGRLHAAPLFPA
jgi:hypothetical protein